MIWLILLWLGAGLLGLFLAMFAVGMMLPLKHTASRSARFSCPADLVFATITDWQAFPAWRSGMVSVEPRPTTAGQLPGWVEISRQGRMPLQIVEMNSPGKLVTRIDDPKLPFGGTWTWQLQPLDEGRACQVTITEDGEIRNPMFRTMARFVFGYTGTMETYLKDLDRRLAAPPAAAQTQ